MRFDHGERPQPPQKSHNSIPTLLSTEEHATDFSCFGFSARLRFRSDPGARSRTERGEGGGKENSPRMFGKSWKDERETRGKGGEGDILIH